MKHYHRLLLTPVLLLVAHPVFTQAVLARWETAPLTGVSNFPLAPTAKHGNISSANLSRNAGGLTATSGDGAYSSIGWQDGGNAEAAFADNDFYTVEITIAPGYSVDFSSLQIALVRSQSGSNNGPTDTELRSNRTGTTSLGNHGVTTTPSLYTYNANFDPGLKNATGTVQFYLLGWNSAGDTNDSLDIGHFAGDDLIIYGTVSLPISLLRFQAQPEGPGVLLEFATASEQNNAYFDVERSADGTAFSTIGRVNGAGNSATERVYRFSDEQPLRGLNCYRLRQVDYDGAFSYSPVVSARVGEEARLMLSPNPAVGELRVQLAESPAEDLLWEVFDYSGRRVLQGREAGETGPFVVPVSTLPTGMYVLRVAAGRELMSERFRVR